MSIAYAAHTFRAHVQGFKPLSQRRFARIEKIANL